MTASGTTKASIESKLPENGGVTPSLAAHMWHNLGGEYPAIVILGVSERTEPADDAEKDPAVKLRVLDIEMPRDDHEAEWLRELLAAWHRKRTAAGTLDEHAAADVDDAITSLKDTLDAAELELEVTTR